MNTFSEQENTERVLDYRQELFSTFYRKQNKHLISLSKVSSSLKTKWEHRYNFESNQIINRLNKSITNGEAIKFFGDIPKPFRLYNWQQMESLTITHRWCPQLDTKGFKAIIIGIREMKNLKGLNLNFVKCYGLHDKGFKKMISNIFHELLGLRHLAFHFEECAEISDQSLALFALELNRNSLNLQSLAFSMPNSPQISDAGIIELLTALDKYSVKLEKLSLNLSGCHLVTQKSLELFNIGSKCCRRLCNLQQLILNFSWNKEIDDEVLENFTDGICYYYINLNLLSLNFSACNKVSNRGFLAVGSKTVKSLKQLEKLLLNFGGCVKITSRALETLAADITTWKPDMKHLKISLIGCLNIPSDTKKVVKTSLKHIAKLEIA